MRKIIPTILFAIITMVSCSTLDCPLNNTVYTKYKQFVDNCFAICPRQALHAKTLGFEHPVTKEKLFFETDLPEDIASVIEKWRKYIGHKGHELD